MKYKIMGLVLCMCAIALALLAPSFEKDESPLRVHQHLEAAEKTPDTAKAQGFSTHLPLVMIDTDGVAVPGKSVVGKDGKRYITKAADGSATIGATMDIVDHETTYNHASDPSTVHSNIIIHVRGRSSRRYDKPSYAVRLVTEDGENNPQEVMGMDAHHEWVLHGPYLDKTLMRNYMWYNIGGEIMDYAPNVRFCELILNGKYQGVYVMTETLTAGENGARLNLSVNAKNNTFSGFLLQYNSGESSNRAMTNQFTAYTKRLKGGLEIVYPGRQNLTSDMQQEISQAFSDFEKALYSYDYDSKNFGYKQYIDVQNFVDYFLINELTCNYDAGWFSTYIGKDPAGKYRMYLWDMNACCDNYPDRVMDRHNFNMQTTPWFKMIIKDEDFVDLIINRYWQLRETVFDPDALCTYIDDTAAYLGEAAIRNNKRWPEIYAADYEMLSPNSRNSLSYEESLAQMKTFLQQRIAWMDENIESLRQYSAESRVKKFSEVAN